MKKNLKNAAKAAKCENVVLKATLVNTELTVQDSVDMEINLPLGEDMPTITIKIKAQSSATSSIAGIETLNAEARKNSEQILINTQKSVDMFIKNAKPCVSAFMDAFRTACTEGTDVVGQVLADGVEIDDMMSSHENKKREEALKKERQLDRELNWRNKEKECKKRNQTHTNHKKDKHGFEEIKL